MKIYPQEEGIISQMPSGQIEGYQFTALDAANVIYQAISDIAIGVCYGRVKGEFTREFYDLSLCIVDLMGDVPTLASFLERPNRSRCAQSVYHGFEYALGTILDGDPENMDDELILYLYNNIDELVIAVSDKARYEGFTSRAYSDHIDMAVDYEEFDDEDWQ